MVSGQIWTPGWRPNRPRYVAGGNLKRLSQLPHNGRAASRRRGTKSSAGHRRLVVCAAAQCVGLRPEMYDHTRGQTECEVLRPSFPRQCTVSHCAALHSLHAFMCERKQSELDEKQSSKSFCRKHFWRKNVLHLIFSRFLFVCKRGLKYICWAGGDVQSVDLMQCWGVTSYMHDNLTEFNDTL